ncbi:hypothetical protein RDE2_25160 [Rhodococcus sp. RDE2]|nr:hypothetical protein RDE2_25160 [Rhodococcus sp. RDE2]
MDFRSLQLVQQRTGGGVVDHHAEVDKNRLVVAQVDHRSGGIRSGGIRSGGVLVIWLVHGAFPGKQHFLPSRVYRRRRSRVAMTWCSDHGTVGATTVGNWSGAGLPLRRPTGASARYGVVSAGCR